MKAITRQTYGPPSILKIEEVATPKPKDNEVLIRVHFTTVNRTDCAILRAKPFVMRLFTGWIKPSLPIVGTDFAGKIVEVGNKVKKFKAGDRVFGFYDQGLSSQAEYVLMNSDGPLSKIPKDIDFAEAVACAEGGHYAYNFINKVKLREGDKAIVNGATGAIGSSTLQILKSRGVYVTAVGNTKNIALLSSLGANKVYDYEKEDFTELEKEKFDFFFDAVGKSSFGKCKHLLKPKAIYLSSELGRHAQNLYLPLITKIAGGKKVIFPVPTDCKRSLLFLSDLLETGKLQGVIDRVYKPEEIAEAYEYVESGQKTGSVLIDFT